MNSHAVHSLRTRGVKKKLDLVEAVFEFRKTPTLEDVIIIGAQHILPSTLTMLNSFFERGLSPKNVFLIGKCYSTDLPTFHELRDMGVYVCPSSLAFHKEASFDSYYYSNIKSFVSEVLHSLHAPNKQLILAIDDGGALISQLNNYQDPKLSIVGIEQTTSGYRLLEQLKLNLGVVNVARSKAKLQHESKIVAKTIIKEFYNKLLNGLRAPEKILIFGNGALGSALANALEGKFDVYLADIKAEKSNIACGGSLSDLPEFDLIFGCVGQTVLSLEQISKLKKGTTLASVSSSDREFEIVQARTKASHLFTCHDDFTWKGIKILNCGFPLNFSGRALDVDIQEFELTRSLLTLGILQAIEMRSKRGFIPLCHQGQKMLIDQFLEKYSSIKLKA